MGEKIIKEHKSTACKTQLRAIHDTLDILSGRWKMSVIGALIYMGKCRFMELQREVEGGIGSKMLSQVLKELETNDLVKRTVFDTKPVTVEYELTPYGRTLEPIITSMADWGFEHRKRIMG